jgi:PAS domain S-box-containing protein
MSFFPLRCSIKYHLLGYFFLTHALVLILSGSIIYWVVYENMRRNVMEQLAACTVAVRDVVENAAALSIRNHLQGIATTNIDLLSSLERQVEEGRLSREEAMHRGEQLLLAQQVGDHGYIYVLSSRGTVIIHPDPEMMERDISEFWFVRQQMFYKNGYLEYEWNDSEEDVPRPKALHMAYFAPWDWIISVSGYRSDFYFLADDLRQGLQSYHFGANGYAFIINSQGDIILHPWLKENVTTTNHDYVRALFKQLLAGKNGEISYLWRDPPATEFRKKRVFFNHIKGLDWIVAATVYEDEIFQPLVRLGYVIALVVAGALTLIIPLGLYLGGLITRPIFRLTHKIKMNTGGDLGINADEHAVGEIGMLGQQLNEYMGRVRRSKQALLVEISERIQVEQQLLLFRRAVAHALVGIGITDATGSLVAVNSAFSEITGYAPDEMIGRPMSVLSSDNENRELYCQVFDILLETGWWCGEIRNRRKSGEVFAGYLRISAIHDEQGVVAHYVAVFQDVTEQKQEVKEH